jgi:hypothetical protein
MEEKVLCKSVLLKGVEMGQSMVFVEKKKV